ncbi:thioredoxin domain-containing protein [bacterium]|nr:thioredoxin domain-containing protein [bacterium]
MSTTPTRPTIPTSDQIEQLPPDGGPEWNRLVFEQSPYLLQHAANPVDWYPWGEEAFDRAREEDKPIFLSIGYATCHWCHVMEHECFEDEEVAEILNRNFIPIKVDREERPDIDRVYMSAVTQVLGGQGGWPLTVILTPDRKPFFAGTYIPKWGRFGRPGLMDLAPELGRIWREEQKKVTNSADQIAEALAEATGGAPGEALDLSSVDQALAQFGSQFDPIHGGFGQAPKFPVPHNLSLLLRVANRTSKERPRGMVEATLHAMRQGGIFDHIGFGFHRYSTDEQWLVPHFEKMLYDQALLAIAYTEAFQATQKPEYRRTAEEIFTYVLRDMTSPEGAFYSAEDADSEGVEGKFYVWTPDEVNAVLGEEDGGLFCRIFNITLEGNYHDEATGASTGSSIPHLTKTIHEFATELSITEEELHARLNEMRTKLFAAREQRIHPLKDDKILTDWNGLMIAALARGAMAFGEPKYAAAATRAADYVLDHLRADEGRLLKRSRLGKAGLPAHLEDYAFLIWGLTDLYEATFDVRYLREALDLQEILNAHFWDDQNGGYFQTADDAEGLLVRAKEVYDGATPSGNSVSAFNLLRLARMTGRSEYEERADRTMKAFSAMIERIPHAHPFMLMAVDFAAGPTREIVIAGDEGAKDVQAMADIVRRAFLPRAVLLHRPEGEAGPIGELAPFIAEQTSQSGTATAYICEDFTCRAPITSLEELQRALEEAR